MATRRIRAVGVLFAGSLALGACGGGGSGTSSTSTAAQTSTTSSTSTTSTTTSTSSTTTSTTTTPDKASYPLDRTAWVGADEVHFIAATVDPATATVEIQGEVTNHNLSDQAGSDIILLTPVYLVSGASTIRVSNTSVQPTLIGQTTSFTWQGSIPAESPFDFSQADLVLGAGTENQSTVPFDNRDVETFVPTFDTAKGTTVKNKAYRADVVGSILRATYTGASKGGRELLIHVKVTGVFSQVGGYRVNADGFVIVDSTGQRILGEATTEGHLMLTVLDKDKRADDWVMFRVEDTQGPYKLEASSPDVPKSTATVDLTF